MPYGPYGTSDLPFHSLSSDELLHANVRYTVTMTLSLESLSSCAVHPSAC